MKVRGEAGEAMLFNFVLPTMYHYIEVKKKEGSKRVEKVYSYKDLPKGDERREWKGEDWWTTCVPVLVLVVVM